MLCVDELYCFILYWNNPLSLAVRRLLRLYRQIRFTFWFYIRSSRRLVWGDLRSRSLERRNSTFKIDRVRHRMINCFFSSISYVTKKTVWLISKNSFFGFIAYLTESTACLNYEDQSRRDIINVRTSAYRVAHFVLFKPLWTTVYQIVVKISNMKYRKNASGESLFVPCQRRGRWRDLTKLIAVFPIYFAKTSHFFSLHFSIVSYIRSVFYVKWHLVRRNFFFSRE